MYQLRFNDYLLYDPRGANSQDLLIAKDVKPKLTVNGVDSLTFSLAPDHPYLSKLSRMCGRLELLQGNTIIYRGRITSDLNDLYRQPTVRTEGQLACLNDSCVEPFTFPDDFAADPEYNQAAKTGNVVEYFIRWLFARHNEQVGAEQQLHVGTVTVRDPNNYLYRSQDNVSKTWSVLRDKLFNSELGGYLVTRYELDATYVDYLAELPVDNRQGVTFGKNLLNLSRETVASDIFTAIRPTGKDGLTIESLPDGDLTSDLVKAGKIIYSRSAEAQIGGRITKPIAWNDVTLPENLRSNSMQTLLAGMAMPETITAKACDLSIVDSSIPAFRVGTQIPVHSAVHGVDSYYPLVTLEPDIFKPANTVLTLGKTTYTVSLALIKQSVGSSDQITVVKKEVLGTLSAGLAEVRQETSKEFSRVDQDANVIRLSVEKVSGNVVTLQKQIDGQIQTYFYNYVPTLSNEPAVSWETDTERAAHLGDLFYIVDNAEMGGLVYRWVLLDGIYSWAIVEDAAVAQALSVAQQAKDTADGKRRVFVEQPYPPYDVGDLWSGGPSGDLMRCQTAKTAGQSFSSDDWGKASKYTDNTFAEAVNDELTRTKASIQILSDGIESKVSKDNIVSSINQSPEAIKILAKFLELTGAVSFSSFDPVTQQRLVGAENTARAAASAAKAVGDNIYFPGSTLIDGAKIYSGSVTAEQIDVAELFARELNVTGKFTCTAQAFLEPNATVRETIINHLLGLEWIPNYKIPLYDFNGDGSISGTDLVMCQSAILGKSSLANWSGAKKTDVTVTIDLSDPARAIVLSGVDMWGNFRETVVGVDPAVSTFASKELLESIVTMDPNGGMTREIDGEIEYINPPMDPGGEYRTSERWLGKAVYARVVDYGNLPNDEEGENYTLPPDLDIIDISGYAVGPQYIVPVPGYMGITNVGYTKSTGNLWVATDRDMSDYHAYVAVKYVKPFTPGSGVEAPSRLVVTDDGAGNVTIYSLGKASITYDDNGHVTIVNAGTTSITIDSSGHVTIF